MKNELLQKWIELKEVENNAQSARRAIEDELSEILKIDATKEGSKTIKHEGFVLKITTRIDRKVDADKIQELAMEHGVEPHLAVLFRWKPEISMTQWKQTDKKITDALAAGITAKPSRPSFSITKKED